MTFNLMSPVIRKELSSLSPSAKMALMALVRNKVFIIVGPAQLTATDDRVPMLVRARARSIERAGNLFIDELDEVLNGRDPNASLGAVEK